MGLADRVVGGVLGLALGDALGAPFEGLRAEEVPSPLPALVLPGPGRPPGYTTDDTALARNLVRSLAERSGFDPEDLLRRHVAWFRAGGFGIGSLTRRVLSRVARGEPPAEAARAAWEERGPAVSAGNGSVMYCAPLGLAHALRPEALTELAPALSALTHYDGRCRTAVLAVSVAAAALARGEARGAAVEAALAAAAGRPGGGELAELLEVVGRSRAVDGPDMGYCLLTAAVALQTLRDVDGFEDGLRRVVGLGGDTDTNGAVAGALLGTAVGRGGLPPAWLERLQDGEAIEAEAEGLVALAEGGPGAGVADATAGSGPAVPGSGAREETVTPERVFRLVVKADDLLKYARPDTAALRAEQARRLLLRAREQARAMGDEALLAQIDRRLAET